LIKIPFQQAKLPFGSNIGFDGSLYNSGTPATDNHDLIKGFQKFQGQAGQTFNVDGIAVTQDYFMETLNSNRFGGMFGLLEKSAKASAQRVKTGEWWATETWNTGDDENLVFHTRHYKESDVFGGYAHQSWAVNWALIPTEQQTRQQQTGQKTNRVIVVFHSQKDKPGIARRIINIVKWASENKECADAFRDAGATPIAEQLDNVFITENIFRTYAVGRSKYFGLAK
jgi:hypothetical protein